MGAAGAWPMGAWWAVFLLCGPGQGANQVPGLARPNPARCGPGQVLHQKDNFLFCCIQCNSSIKPCPSQQLRDCTCATPGEFCVDSDCNSCKKHTCSPGQEVVLLGNFAFALTCKDCEVGTYSDGVDGKCLPWTDCSRVGFLTVRPGNRTHNTLCGMAPFPASASASTSALASGLSSSYNIPMAVQTALATITFMLVVIQLVLHISWVKKESSAKDKESILTPGHGPPDDIGNCPFPEEEWGEKTAEDKAQMGQPWV